MFKIIVAGGRHFNDWDLCSTKLDRILKDQKSIEIVSGGAKGADELGELYAKTRNYKLKVFPADWDKFGKSAGYRRNKEMAEYADALVAFWDGNSVGTKMMIELAKKNNIGVRVITYTP